MKRAISSMVVIAAMILAAPALADDAGQFTELEGKITIERGGQKLDAAIGTEVIQGDLVKTARGAKGTILFKDGSVLRLGPSTTLEINQLVYQEDTGVVKAAYDLAAGTIMSIVGSLFGGDESEYTVNTPTAVSGVRGTSFIVKVGIPPGSNKVTTMLVGLDGKVYFQGEDGNYYYVAAGQYSMATSGGGATEPTLVSDEMLQSLLDSVNVSFTSLNQRALGMRTSGGNQPPPSGGGTFVPIDLTLGAGGDDGDNPDDQGSINDSPENVIYQEPPQVTELILIVDVP